MHMHINGCPVQHVAPGPVVLVQHWQLAIDAARRLPVGQAGLPAGCLPRGDQP